MCFFSKPKTPSVQTPPPPAPAPVITPSEVSPQQADEARRKKLENLRAGFASTIKTGPKGVTGTGADLKAASLYGKSKLGA